MRMGFGILFDLQKREIGWIVIVTGIRIIVISEEN